MFTAIGSFLIGYCFIPVTALFTILFLVILIDGEFDFGLMDRVCDAAETINKKMGRTK